MVAGIELSKKYAQISVKTELMKEPESITTVVGTEQYRIPVEGDLCKKDELQEFFRKLWKMLQPFGDKEPLEYLFFCLEDHSPELRRMLLEIAQNHDVSEKHVRFLEKKECFCAYVLHQGAELLSRNALLIENTEGAKSYYLLHKQAKTNPAVAKVYDVTEKPLEQVFLDHGISSVFLVGDDFEEDWMQQHMKLLKSGRRVFAGKNLFVKGACYRGMEWKDETEEYLYLGEDKLCCDILLKTLQDGTEEYLTIVKGGKNWDESKTSVDVLLLDEPELEFVIAPIGGGEKKTVEITLKDLPKRPKKTTRLRLEVSFESSCQGKVLIKDLGFGELFPASDMNYKGELQWEQ